MTISEPVGGSAPKFSQKSSGFILTEKAFLPFSLCCPAQGSPIPSYRSVLLRTIFQNQSVDQLQNLLLRALDLSSRNKLLNHSALPAQLKGPPHLPIGQTKAKLFRACRRLSAQVLDGDEWSNLRSLCCPPLLSLLPCPRVTCTSV